MTIETALTFEQMAHIEPRLGRIVRFAAHSLLPMFGLTLTARSTAFEYGKAAALVYVGHGARRPELRSSECYERFIDHLAQELDL